MSEEIKIEEALKRAITAQRNGNTVEADRYYTAILKVQSDHPDANHNLGILAMEMQLKDIAFPLFAKAINANPKFIQFYLTYIQALISVNEIAQSKNIIQQGRDNQLSEPEIEKLIQFREKLICTKTQNLPPREKVDEILALYENGDLEEVIKQAENVLLQYPKASNLMSICGAAYAKSSQFQKATDFYNKAIKINPNSAEIYNNLGNVLHSMGSDDAAIQQFNKAIEINPNFAEAHFSRGRALQISNKPADAIEAYKKTVTLKPAYFQAYNNLGNTFKSLGEYEKALNAYNKVIELRPDLPQTHNNLGVLFRETGDSTASMKSLKTATTLEPDYHEAHNNLSITYRDIGLLEDAEYHATVAISKNPNYFQAYNNLGNIFSNQGNLQDARKSYLKALEIAPNYTDAIWNLHGIAKSVDEAIQVLGRSNFSGSIGTLTKFTLSMLKAYTGDTSELYDLIHSKYAKHSYIRSFKWVFEQKHLPQLFFSRWDVFDFAVSKADKNLPFYEFGVWRGQSFRYLKQSFASGYGFDTFSGLPEDWHNEKAGTYTSDNHVPTIPGGEFVVGRFEDTLPKFFSKPRPKASLINFDADLYSSTLCALRQSKDVISRDTILVFDEFLINPNWEDDEFKALEHFCSDFSYSYEVLAVSFFSKQVVIKIGSTQLF